MKKQTKQLVWLLILVVVFAGAYFGIRAYNKSVEEQEEAAAADNIYVLQLEADDIQAFSYVSDGAEFSFTKSGDEWLYDADAEFDVDEDAIATMLGKLESVAADRVVENVVQTSEYGFDEPANAITVKLADREVTLKIGMYNELLSGYYMMTDEDETRVYIGGSTVYSTFNKTISDLEAEVVETDAESEEGTELDDTES